MSGKSTPKSKSAQPAKPPAKPTPAAAKASEQTSTTVTDVGLKPEAPAQMRQPNGPAEVLGDVVWLMSHSPAHKHMFISDIEWLVMPPIMSRQFRLFRKEQAVIGYVSWAFLSEDIEGRFMQDPRKLSPKDWKSGDRAWIIDLIAPFGGGDKMLNNIKSGVFSNLEVKTVLATAEEVRVESL